MLIGGVLVAGILADILWTYIPIDFAYQAEKAQPYQST
jgi:hypothetical protein